MFNRILIGLLGIPCLIWVLLIGGTPLYIFVNLVILIGLFEFYKMAEISGKKPDIKLGCLAGVSIPYIIKYIKPEDSVMVLMPIVLLVICSIALKVFQNKVENSSRDIGITVLGVIYVSGLFSHLLLMEYLDNGTKWILVVQVLVWLCDSFAYFTGIAIGRKFFKSGFSTISPKKSIEGSIGGIVATMIGIYLINQKFGIFASNVSSFIVLGFGFMISIVAQIGDLGESMFKREFKVKDSGRILGEHGGILDRFDSMLFVVPVVYYLLKFV